MTDERETRYARGERIKRERERHASITGRLSGPTIDEFDEAMDDFTPECRRQGLPSKWIDWDSDPERREPYESNRPNAQEAWDLCTGCPIAGQGKVCYRYAEVTDQAHGVWGGYRRENGKWVVGFD